MIIAPDANYAQLHVKVLQKQLLWLKSLILWGHNKKAIMPQIDYGKCVFCGLCVDACPFYALYMSNDYELSSFTKEGLIYTPAQLQVKPQVQQDSEIIIDKRGARHG